MLINLVRKFSVARENFLTVHGMWLDFLLVAGLLSFVITVPNTLRIPLRICGLDVGQMNPFLSYGWTLTTVVLLACWFFLPRFIEKERAQKITMRIAAWTLNLLFYSVVVTAYVIYSMQHMIGLC